MKTLVTGGIGFIGTRLVQQLLSTGERVRILSLPMPIPDFHPADHVEYSWGDVRDEQVVQQALDGVHRVYHLAAYARNWVPDSNQYFDINVGGTENILRHAFQLGIQRVVVTSSNVVFGPSQGTLIDENAIRKTDFLTAYERSKFAAEQIARAYAHRGLETILVNPTRVFGPGSLSEANSVTKMLQWYLQGTWRFILGSGQAIGNYVFIDDLVRGHILAMERGTSGENYILGGENVTFNDFFDELASYLNHPYILFHLPARGALLFASFERFRAQRSRHYPLITPGWTKTFLLDWAYSSNKAERDLGYRITPFSAAIAETVRWLIQEKIEIPRIKTTIEAVAQTARSSY
jgi:farnesol dehydrogenase